VKILENKFKFGQKVWFVGFSAYGSFEITRIQNCCGVLLYSGYGTSGFNEDELFLTEEEAKAEYNKPKQEARS